MKKTHRLKLKNNFNLKFFGTPSLDISEISDGNYIGISPANFKFLKAKLLVKVGDSVKQGQALFFDKKSPQVYFHSPVSGTIEDIVYGPQRRLDLIKIKRSNDTPLKFSTVSIDSVSSTEFKSVLLERGLWTGFTEMPFYNIPEPTKIPPVIMVPLSHSEPFQPKLSTVIDEYEEDIIDGIKWLRKLSPELRLFIDSEEKINLDKINDEEQVTRVHGDFGATGAGAVAYHLKTSVEENNAWICSWQHLVKISRTLKTNQYYNETLISVGGNQEKDNQHYLVTEGTQLSDIFKLKNKTDRVICGGLFSGLHIPDPEFLPIACNAINIIDNDPQTEFLSFMQPGFDKPSYSTAYLSGVINRVLPQLTKTSTAVNGSNRDCVSCGYCEIVCPVDTVPQTLLRNVKSNDVEEGMRIGLLDCSGCGACTYVCPSKIDLASSFVDMKNQLYKELNA